MPGWDGVELAPYFAEVVAPRRSSWPTTPTCWPAPSCFGPAVRLARRARRQGLHRAGAGHRSPTAAWCRVTSARPARSGTPRSRRPTTCRAAAGPPAAWRPSPPAGRWSTGCGRRARRPATCATSSRWPCRATPWPARLLRDSGRQLGEVLAVAINLLNPQAVVIGGDMGAAFDLYAAGVRESVYARATALATRDLQFLPAAHGDSRRPRRLRRAGPRPRAEPRGRRRPARLRLIPARRVGASSDALPLESAEDLTPTAPSRQKIEKSWTHQPTSRRRCADSGSKSSEDAPTRGRGAASHGIATSLAPHWHVTGTVPSLGRPERARSLVLPPLVALLP